MLKSTNPDSSLRILRCIIHTGGEFEVHLVSVEMEVTHESPQRESSPENDDCSTTTNSNCEGPLNVFSADTGKVEDIYVLTDEVLGRGGNAVVFKCYDRETNSEHACKRFTKTRDPHHLKAIDDEVTIMIALYERPHIVTIHDIFEDADFVYIVMEHCAGGSLWDLVKRQRQQGLSETEVAVMMLQVMEALDKCASKGVVHRDIKPENILLTQSYTNMNPENERTTIGIKVCDFGLSTFIQPIELLDEPLGTPAYTAPEVLLECYDCRADVWSAGCTMYFLLCGQQPFEGAVTAISNFENMDRRKLLTAHAEFERAKFVIPSSEFWDGVSEGAKDILSRMLTMEVSERLTVKEFKEHPWVTEQMKKFHGTKEQEIIEMQTSEDEAEYESKTQDASEKHEIVNENEEQHMLQKRKERDLDEVEQEEKRHHIIDGNTKQGQLGCMLM